MYASPIGDVVAQAAACLIEVDARLVPLFSRTFPAARVFPRTRPAGAGVTRYRPSTSRRRSATCSAGCARPTTLSRSRVAYLLPDAGKVSLWRERLRRYGDGPIVGISWRSRLVTHLRNAEFTRLEEWGPIFSVPGLIFVNLQYDESRAEIEEAQRLFGVTVHVIDDVDLFNDLDGAAALTAACDVVVSAPTSVSAMAGAVGVLCYRMTVAEDWLDLGADWTPLAPSVHARQASLRRRLDARDRGRGRPTQGTLWRGCQRTLNRGSNGAHLSRFSSPPPVTASRRSGNTSP